MRLHIIKQFGTVLDERMSEFLVFRLVNLLLVLVFPQMQEIVPEQFELALKFLVVLLHLADLLLERFNICLLHFLELEFEDLHSELHFRIIIERDTREFVFIDPALELVNILGIEKGMSSKFLLRSTAFDSDIKVGHLPFAHWLCRVLFLCRRGRNLLNKHFENHFSIL